MNNIRYNMQSLRNLETKSCRDRKFACRCESSMPSIRQVLPTVRRTYEITGVMYERPWGVADDLRDTLAV